MPLRPDLFTRVIGQLNYGEANEELSEALHECKAAAQRSGKATKLVLTLTVKPHADNQYELSVDVVTKLAKRQRGLTLMFGTADDDLTRHDPRQAELELRGVPVDRPAELKKVQ